MPTAYYSIDHTKIDSALTDFPVGIKIESSTGFMSGLGSTDWQNLHATVDSTECYVEIEYWDTTNDEAVLWVCVPTVSSSVATVIKIETGGINISYVGETGDSAAQAVWDENFLSVLHLRDDATDSTDNGNDGTIYGSMVFDEDDDFAYAHFDGIDDYISLPITISGDFTISFVYNRQQIITGLFLPVITRNVSGGSYQGLAFYGFSDTFHIDLDVTGGTAFQTNPAFTNYEWSQIVVTRNGSTCSLYIDGSFFDSGTVTTDNFLLEVVGYRPIYGSKHEFFMSNLFISNDDRSAAWTKAAYNVLNGSLLTYSATDPNGESLYEPDVGIDSISLGEIVGRSIEKNVASLSTIRFSEISGASFDTENEFDALPSVLGVQDQAGANIEKNVFCIAGIGLAEAIGWNIEKSIGVVESLVLSGGIGASEELTYDAESDIGIDESIGAKYVATPIGPLDDFRFNESDKSSHIDLEADGMRFVVENQTDDSALARTVGFKNGGQWYFEIILEQYDGSGHGYGIGLIDSEHAIDQYRIGGDSSNTGTGFDCNDGDVRSNGSIVNTSTTAADSGDYLQCAVNLDNGRIWFGINDTWILFGNPSSGYNPTDINYSMVGENMYPCASANISTVYGNRQLTIKTKRSEFLGTIPDGFNALSEELPLWMYGRVGLYGFASGQMVGLEQDAFSVSGIGFVSGSGGLNYSLWLRKNKEHAVYRYFARITGNANGIQDYELTAPKSIQLRMRSGETKSYLSFVIPYSQADLEAVQGRPDGQLIIDMVASIGGLESLREELLRADFYSIRFDRGPRSQSITLVGYGDQSFGPGFAELDNIVSEFMNADGTLRYRCAQPDFYLKPGHTAKFGENEIIVDTITCFIGEKKQYMEVSE